MERIHGHAEEGERLEGREDAADDQPVARHADVVVVVAGAEDAGDEGEADDDVEPFFHDLAVHAGELDQQVAEDAAHDEFPDALNPKMHHPPAVKRIERLVVEVDHARQVEQRRAKQAHVEDDRGGGEAFAVPDRPADVGQEEQDVSHHEVVEWSRNFEEFATFPDVEVVANDSGHANCEEGYELDVGEFRPCEFSIGLLGNDEVGGAHESEQEPDEQ
jgi:hypothetical protein